MKKKLLSLIAIAIMVTSCKKTNTPSNYTCTCKATVYISQGFSRDTIIMEKKVFDMGTTATDAQSSCNGKLFWSSMADTFWMNNTYGAGNGYIPSSQISCGL